MGAELVALEDVQVDSFAHDFFVYIFVCVIINLDCSFAHVFLKYFGLGFY